LHLFTHLCIYIIGFPDALYNVGVCYFTGDGVEKDERRALEFWEIAAEHDVPPALVSHYYLYKRLIHNCRLD
jgi:TPR repeat protein